MLNVLNGKKTKKIPVWFMRQAGRYLPEYKSFFFEQKKNFFEVCLDPQLASQITIQPYIRYPDLDALIVFSDILIVPKALGCNVEFIPNKGPVVSPISKVDDLLTKKFLNIAISTSNTIDITKNYLIKNSNKEIPLIGFAGSPWTVACYLLEGTIDYKFSRIKKFCIYNRDEFQKIIDLLTEYTIIYLQKQIDAGADIIQLFDSHAATLSAEEYYKWVITPTKKIVSSLKNYKMRNIPIIGFPKGSTTNLEKYFFHTGVSALSIDYTVSTDWITVNLQDKGIIVQGNLDPYLLAYDINLAVQQTKHILNNLSGKPFIFNLGHGILKDTPVDNVARVLECVKSFEC